MKDAIRARLEEACDEAHRALAAACDELVEYDRVVEFESAQTCRECEEV